MTEGEIAETMGIKNVALCLPQPAAGFSPSVSFADSSLVKESLFFGSEGVDGYFFSGT